MDKEPRTTDGAFYSSIGAVADSHALMLQQAARIADLGYFVFDVEREILEVCSESHAAIFGRTAQEFLTSVSGLKGALKMVHPEDAQLLRDGYARLREGVNIQMEYRFIRPDGSVGHVREYVAPELDEAGSVRRGLGSSIDVSRFKQEDERRNRARRHAALGELTAGVAHDFNNSLAVVRGNAELALELLDQGNLDELRPVLQEIVGAARRGADMTQSLLAFSQRAPVSPTRLDLADEAGITVQMFERLLLKGERILLRAPGGQCLVHTDRTQFRAALVNLLLNAKNAIGPGGRIEVDVRARTLNAQDLAMGDSDLSPGTYAVVAVRDNGQGIPPEILPRVTEPFFTTRSRAEQSGLGLSTVHGFLHQFHGDLLIRSDPGAGAEVSMILPLDVAGDTRAPQGPG